MHLPTSPLWRRLFVYSLAAFLLGACDTDTSSDAHDMAEPTDVGVSTPAPSLELSIGDSLRFTASGIDDATVTWSVLATAGADTLGATIDDAGMLRATAAGRYLVLASSGARQAIAYVRVTESAGTSSPDSVRLTFAPAVRILSLSLSDFWIEVSPDTIAATPGDTLQLSATGHSADGSEWTIRTVWQASDGAVSGTGAYVPPDTAGTFRVVATRFGDIQTDTAIVRSAPATGLAAVPVTAGCRNEPEGYRRVATAAWNALPPRQPEVSSEGFTYFHEQIPTLSIVQDSSAPASPASVLRVLYPAGFRGGESPSRWGTGALGENGGNLYVCLWIRFDPWWSTEGITMDKLFYVHQNESRLNHAMVALGEYDDLFIHALLQFPDESKHYHIGQLKTAENNVAGGGWHKVEVVWEANVPGQRNGRYRHWVDDRLIASAEDAYWFESGNTPHWDTVWFDPIYGRTESIIPRDQSWYMDQTVVSVR